MNTEPVVLRSSSGVLTISIDPKGVGGWCKVNLHLQGADYALGAERLKYIVRQFGSFLASSSPSRRWILSLAELHTSAYGEHVAGEVVIQFQDASARWFAKLVLAAAEKDDWIRQLQEQAES